MIVIGYPGIGKSTIAKKYRKFIDLESSLFKIDGERSDTWYKSYCKVAEDLSKQGYVVFVSSHSAVVKELEASQEDMIVVVPVASLWYEWNEKLCKRWLNSGLDKDLAAYSRASINYLNDIYSLQTCNIPNKICLTSMNYTLAKPNAVWAAFDKDGNLIDAVKDVDGSLINPKMLMVFGNKVEK